MISHTLCRERLDYLLSILDRNGGSLSFRDLWRSYVIAVYEIEQAEELGWIQTFTRKPLRGRPSRIAEKVNKTLVAKLPPPRNEIPKPIKWSHWLFVMNYILTSPPCNGRKAYQATFRNARSKAGARASASRLLKTPEAKAALAWTRAQTDPELPLEAKALNPDSVEEIEAIFREYSHFYRLRQM